MNGFWLLLGLMSGQEAAPTPHQAYAKGLELARQEQREPSAREFETVRAMAQGPAQAELRRAAVYNLGTLELKEGELWRAKLPEIQKDAGAAALPMPPLPKPTLPGAAAGAQAEDPIAKARQHYSAARKHFIERLRIDWRDADTRANAELVTRRLAELDRIEKQRKEQQKQQQQDQKDQQKQDQKDQQQKDPENKDPQDKDSKPEEKPEQQPPAEDQKQESKPEKPQPEEKPQPQAQPEQGEKELSKEEMVQLLDRLQKIEQQAEKLKAQMRDARRTAVKKDW
ncbi:MAG: hypothetical protein ACKO32_05580 [Planctomycetia bacterium]